MAVDWISVLTSSYVAMPAGFAGLMYLGAPLMVQRTLVFDTLAPIDPLVPDQLPPESWQYFGATAPGFAACGFGVCAYARIIGQIPNAVVHFALWANERAGQMAMAAQIGKKQYCEFLTVFDDASSVLTNNSVDLGVFKPSKMKDSAAAPWLADVRELYRLHLYREAQFRGPGTVRYVPPVEGSLAMVGEGTARDLQRQVEVGYFTPTGQEGKYRPTISGAYRMTWKELPPVKQVRRWAAHRKAGEQERAARAIPLSPPTNVRITRTSPYARQHSAAVS